MTNSRFTHPIHARGVRSTDFAVRGGKLLTDRRILHYIKEGRYGTDAQDIANGRKPKAKKKPKKTAMELLQEIRRKFGLA